MRSITLLLSGLVLLSAVSTAKAQGPHKTPEAVLEANINATGGTEAWASITSIVREGTAALDSPMGLMEGTFTLHRKMPGYSHFSTLLSSPMGEVESSVVYTPEHAWGSSPMGDRELELRDWLDVISVKEELTLLDDDSYQLTSLDTKITEKGPIYIVTVEHNGTAYRRHYDQLNLMLLAAERPSTRGTKEWVYYEDYRDVENVKISFAWSVPVQLRMSGPGGDDEQSAELRMTSETVMLNAPISDEVFQK